MLFLVHCATPTPPSNGQNALTSCTEDDVANPTFFGPLAGEDGQLKTKPEGSFFVVSTHMKLWQDSNEAMGIFQQVMAGIQQAFPKSEGLLAASLIYSQKCGYARTVSIWKDYESMSKFVVAEAHAKAMASAPKIASHFRTTHWEEQTNNWPVTWDTAKKKLLDVEVRVYTK